MAKILFIDDEPEQNFRAHRALEDQGYEVTFCDDVLAGLHLLLEKDGWSTVVLDMMMPVPVEWQEVVKDGLTGLKLLAEAREILIERNIPVLVFTNRSTDKLLDRLNALKFPPHLLARLEKDVLLPREFAARVFKIAGDAQRGVPLGPGTWLP